MAEYGTGMRPLTFEQMRVLTAVRIHCLRTGWPASMSEIAQRVGKAGRTSVIVHVHALVAAGLVEQSRAGVRPVGWRYVGR